MCFTFFWKKNKDTSIFWEDEKHRHDGVLAAVLGFFFCCCFLFDFVFNSSLHKT